MKIEEILARYGYEIIDADDLHVYIINHITGRAHIYPHTLWK